MAILKMEDLDLKAQRVLIREDLNVPIKDGVIGNDTRIRAALPTIQFALDAGALPIIMSHLGRPEEGKALSQQPGASMAPVAHRLAELLNVEVSLCQDYLPAPNEAIPDPGSITLLENVRLNKGELANDETLAKAYAALADVFVMDAFGTAHRAQASTHGVAKYAPKSCAGPLLSREYARHLLACR